MDCYFFSFFNLLINFLIPSFNLIFGKKFSSFILFFDIFKLDFFILILEISIFLFLFTKIVGLSFIFLEINLAKLIIETVSLEDKLYKLKPLEFCFNKILTNLATSSICIKFLNADPSELITILFVSTYLLHKSFITSHQQLDFLL